MFGLIYSPAGIVRQQFWKPNVLSPARTLREIDRSAG